MAYLGIDVGTSATKAVVIAPHGAVLARSRVPHPAARRCGPGRVDPTAWRSSVVSAVRSVVDALDARDAPISAVGLDTHAPTALLLDAAGRPLTAGIAWDHPGLSEPTDDLISVLTAEEVALIGNHLMPATAMGAAYRLLQSIEPEAQRTATTFGLAGTWLGQWLTGRRAIDPTQASYTALMASTDGSCRWLGDLLTRFGIPAHQLPPIRPSLSVLGPLKSTAATELGLPEGVPVLVGSGDTPAASYALGSAPGGRPLFIMGTTHVVSNSLAQPDPRALALQRSDVHPQRWLINGVINGGDALAHGAAVAGFGDDDAAVADLVAAAFTAKPAETRAGAPVFIPHIRAERGPLWFDGPHTALVGMSADTPIHVAARGIVEGVLFADRMIIETCVGRDQRTLYVSGAFGDGPAMPQLLADALDRVILVVDESHLPAVGAAAMCSEVLDGRVVTPPETRRVSPRIEWRATVAARWTHYRDTWSSVTGVTPLGTLDEAMTAP
ncbi:xylulokinase [Mycolicibacterium goodii]|uniref:Xylulose kinase n=1 Tax=Mycolicibacterium goodii TaxID=134601 RepID=A0A0K0XBY6_MYCGD|nr:xylulose kinase [Mycolicibacterium goodii]